MSLHSDDPDEPQFSQFRDRISGLSKGTRKTLWKPCNRDEISEILNIDVATRQRPPVPQPGQLLGGSA